MNSTGLAEEKSRLNGDAILLVDRISKRFGGLHVLNEVSLEVKSGSIISLIGPNGAGKSTLLNILSGLEKSENGSVIFKGCEISNKPPHQTATLGIGRTFQAPQIAQRMSVVENIMTGLHYKGRSGIFLSCLKMPSARREDMRFFEISMELIRFMGLEGKENLPAGGLSYGEKRLLEIARSLAPEPDLILMDEPAAGLNRQETDLMTEKIRTIREKGTTVFLVEHDMRMVMDISDEVAVLNYGILMTQGTPEMILENPDVIECYLGKGSANASC